MNLISGQAASAHGAHTIGIRPEHVTLSTTEGMWRGVVTVAEHLGSDNFLHVQVEGVGTITTRTAENSLSGTGTPSSSRRTSPVCTNSMTRDLPNDCRLNGKSAMITGAARGIGRAFAEAYVREGATAVAIADIDFDRATATAAEIGPAAYAVRIDVSDQGSIDEAVQACVDRAGGIDILINNAAIFDLAPIVEITRRATSASSTSMSAARSSRSRPWPSR